MMHLGWLYIEGNVVPFDEPRGRELLACAGARVAKVSKAILSGAPPSTIGGIFDHG